jgi:PTS system mannose-specific IIB component/fructoselysine and glucoselysine-specific PTS system IIB component
MPILLFRVDERLIHGQVVVGWGAQLRPERYLVVDQALSTSEWERDLYVLSLPERIEAEFLDPLEARDELQGWTASEVRSILLTRDIQSMLALARGGRLQGEEVNLGGLHFQEGREEVLPYIFLSPEDRTALQELAAEGVKVSARNLPGSAKVLLDSLLS